MATPKLILQAFDGEIISPKNILLSCVTIKEYWRIVRIIHSLN